MKRWFLLLAVIMTGCSAWGQVKQQGLIKGHIIDNDSREPLENASVALLNAKDSSIAASTFTDKKGAFALDHLKEGNYQLYVTYLGYKSLLRNVAITAENKTADMENVPMERIGVTLGLVEIVDIKPPMVMKKDTLEFNASYYKTRENAVIEELLKKLPGVEIDRDGGIKVNGQPIKQLLVDGRPFFGDDPKMATRNLPADIIDKIQLIDRKSDQAQFTGIEDGQRDKAINITLKKDKKKGYFGRGTVGYGTDERFAATANANKFHDQQQLSFMASGNNINGVQDGGARIGGSGITNAWNGGANYSTDINKDVKISASYYTNKNRTTNQRTSARQNLLPDTTYYYNLDNQSTDDATNHTMDMRMEFKPDTTLFLTVGANFNYSSSNSLQANTYESLDGHQQLVNNGTTRLTNNSKAPNLSTTVFLGKRFRKTGRTLSSTFNLGFNKSDQQGFNKTYNLFVQPNGDLDRDTIDQRNDMGNRNQMFSANIIYTEPLSKTRFLELTYALTRNHGVSDKFAYDFDPSKGTYESLNDSLSNNFENTSLLQSGGISIRTQKVKYDYSLGVNAQYSYLDNDNISTHTRLEQTTLNYSPFATFNYAFTNNNRLRLYYAGNTQQPSVAQLQPVPDNSNPLYIQLGNPDLKPSFTHNINMGYNAFNPVSFRGFAANVSSSLTMNKIVSSSTFDSLGRQVTQPLNVNGSYNINANISNTFPLKRLQTAINTSTSASFNRDISFINGVKGATRNLNIMQGLNFSYAHKELFDLSLAANVNYTGVRYSVQPNNNTHYFNYTLFFNGNLNLPLGFIIGGNLDYLLSTGRAAGFNQGATMLNAYISKSLFQRKQGLIKLQGFDLLKRNLSLTRNVGENAIEDVQTQVLQRFFLLSFTYFLKPGGGSK